MKTVNKKRNRKTKIGTLLELANKHKRAEQIIDKAILHGWKGSKQYILAVAKSIREVRKLIGILGNPNMED